MKPPAAVPNVSTMDESDSRPGSPTFGDDAQYEFKSVRAIRGTEARTIEKWKKDGWEVDTRSQGTLRTEMTFRRVKPKTLGTYLWAFVAQSQAALRRLEPKTRLRLLAVSGGLILLMVMIGIVVGIQGGGGTPESTPLPTEAAVVPSEQPSEALAEEPTEELNPSEPAEAAPVTDAEVVDAFRAYLDERAATGVVVATTVTDVSFSDRVVRVTFDPAAAGMDQARFDEVNLFENLAQFVSTPISFNDDLGPRLRPAIDAIETVQADGTALGTRTTAEIIELNELED